jgi:hypothetical protein
MIEQSRRLLGRTVHASLRQLGFELFKREPDHHYVPNYYGRTARKHLDVRSLPTFGEVAQQTISEGRCLLYYDRLYTIYQCVEQSRRLTESPNFAEVGVFRGGTSRFIARAAAAVGLKATHYAVDTFEGHAAEDIRNGVDTRHKAGHLANTDFAQVSQYLSPHPNVKVTKGRIQDVADSLADKTFHFVHLDVDLYAPTVFGLKFFGDRLAVGGTIVVDDYGSLSAPGIVKSVSEFVAANPNYGGLHLLSSQYLLTKTG